MLGDQIKKLRSKANMTQIELCELLNIEQSTLANYENNKRSPKIDILISIARHFNVTTDYLLGLTQTPDSNVVLLGEQLDDDEKKLIETYRSLTSDEKLVILGKAMDYKLSSTTANKKKDIG